jgi:hypothetical protein
VLGLVRSGETAVLLLDRGITAVVAPSWASGLAGTCDKSEARPWFIDELQPATLKTDVAVVFDAPAGRPPQRFGYKLTILMARMSKLSW